jgi:hypothetical protein
MSYAQALHWLYMAARKERLNQGYLRDPSPSELLLYQQMANARLIDQSGLQNVRNPYRQS